MKRIAGPAVPAMVGAAVLALGLVARGGAEVRDWLMSSGERDEFGRAVAVVGEDVLVGEARPAGAPGTVYVYRRSGGEWTEQGRIQGSDRVGDGFGSSMAVEGTTVLIGAGTQNSPAEGGAFFYERDASGSYRQVQALTPPDSGVFSMFGYAVALDGSTALVGAPLIGATEAGPQTAKGAAYVYERAGAGQWSLAATLAASDAREGGFFGVTVALDGERALVVSPTMGAYTFERGVNGWTETGKVTVEGIEQNDAFGAALLLRGDSAFVGTPNRGGTGAVFLLVRTAAGWTGAGSIDAPDGAIRFGASLAYADGRLWVGAPASMDGRGAVYVFERAGEAWRPAGTVELDSAQAGDQFGGAIATEGSALVVGMNAADHGLGKAAIFEGGANAWRQVALMAGKAETYESVTGTEVACREGAAGDFACGGVDLLAFLPIESLGGSRGIQLNDVWGWTDPSSGKEYALVGRVDGSAFVDLSDPVNPVYVGQLPMTPGSQANSWRDIKVYRDHAYIVADGAGQHGVQVFDLTRLREFAGEPITWDADTVYDRVASAHNIVINEESGFAYAVGSNSGGETCGGGLHMIDIREPKQPKFAGCFADTETGMQRTGYSHDAQCVTYHGPDAEHQGREICIGSNETAISVADVTDKANPKGISRASYPNVAYTHQGWFTDDHRYFLVNDEGDEVSGVVPRTRTLIWDLADLDDPQLAKEYLGETAASDHNLYIRGNLVYESNYASGLRILDITDPLAPREVGFFDTQPVGENVPGYTGSWSNYPFFQSGVIAVSSIEQGLFLVRYRPTRPVS